jgi:hypothetical protein
LINKSKVKIKYVLGTKMLYKENYEVVIIMRFLLHQNIVHGQNSIKTEY